MTPTAFLAQELLPALAWLEQVVGPVPPASRQARIMLLAMPGQESLWQNVQQSGGGPGRGFYQDEPETCGEVLNNPASSLMMLKVCAALGILATGAAIYMTLLGQPKLQVALSRGDLFCDPRPLPAYGDARGAWTYYKRDWGPGDPHPAIWDGIYAQAISADKGTP
jgi:hypothetical protein